MSFHTVNTSSVLFKVIFEFVATFCIYYFRRKLKLYSVEIQTLWKGSGIAEEQLSGKSQRLLEQCWLTHSEDTEQMPPLGWGSAKPWSAGRR